MLHCVRADRPWPQHSAHLGAFDGSRKWLQKTTFPPLIPQAHHSYAGTLLLLGINSDPGWAACLLWNPSSWVITWQNEGAEMTLHSADCNLILNPISLCFLKRLTASLWPALAFHESQNEQAATSFMWSGLRASSTSSGLVSGSHYKSVSAQSPWSSTSCKHLFTYPEVTSAATAKRICFLL